MATSSFIPGSLVNQLRSIDAVRRTVIAARQMRTAAIERYLRIHTPYPNTHHFDLQTHFNDAVPNEPVDYVLLRRFMKHVSLSHDDVVFDIGCGMGRVLCMFARRRVKKCIGIEFDAALAEIARRNARTLRGRRTPVEVRCGDAIEADYADGTVYWFFNPFGSKTLRAVLERIEMSVCRSPRPIQIAYINPIHEQEFAESSWLQCTGREQSIFYGCYGASYWRNRPTADSSTVFAESGLTKMQNSVG